ncbi:MAG: diacylglycerol kinase family lipid kinase, partial [Firmicutes bacterium]|nr:diacylglycerol kinase family lipid kinase [Bacillota bacterium]
MNKKMLFLFNIKAGTSGIRAKAADIIDIFTRGGYDVLAHPSQSATDMEDIVKARGNEFDVVVTCGGDGSLNDTINGLMALDNPPPLGYIPTGTMNDFASSHRLSNNMLIAASDIVHGVVTYTDVGCFNGRYFSYVAAFGAFTDVSYGTPQSTKNVLGKSAYILEAIKRIPLLSSNHLRIKCDDLELENDYIYGMASNSLTVAGIPLDRKGELELDDGRFNIVLIRKGISDILNAQVML